jgi:hypothetical protein
MEQVKFSFDEVTIRKIVIGALIAGAGAVLTYVAQLGIDFGVFTPFATAIMAILVNSLREYSKGK